VRLDGELPFWAGLSGVGEHDAITLQTPQAIPATLLVLPGLAKVEGRDGVQWSSHLEVFNPTEEPQPLRIELGGITVERSVNPGDLLSIDTADLAFQGVASGTLQGEGLEVLSWGSSMTRDGVTRFHTLSPVDATAPGRRDALPGLRIDERYRVNLVLTNLGESRLSGICSAFGEYGAEMARFPVEAPASSTRIFDLEDASGLQSYLGSVACDLPAGLHVSAFEIDTESHDSIEIIAQPIH